MKKQILLLLSICICLPTLFAQDSLQPFQWQVSSKKLGDKVYELVFQTNGNKNWQLYAPQLLNEVATTELQLVDSSIVQDGNFVVSGSTQNEQSALFGISVQLMNGATQWKKTLRFSGDVPAQLKGVLLYTYGKGEEFYPSTSYIFTVALEGGVQSTARIKIASLDVKNPVNNCGDDNTADKSLFTIFLLGFLGGLIALITPCVFPLIPLTVSFFTKRSGNRQKGLRNAFVYGFSIFLIYVLLSLPFHLVDKANPDILNNISTNVWVNIAFFIVFIFFALSFFGLYELALPSSFANKVDSKSGLNDIWGIFFMALTLAIVSFSCTGPILGSLLAGVSGGGGGGATALSFGMGGFGVGLGLPFALFAMFPQWLQSLPKSGGWLTSVKVTLGFLELALAVKFLSNADLVKQWHLLEREVFIGIWIIIGIGLLLYLTGVICFGGPKPKFTAPRILFIVLFGTITLYLLPGLTNTKWAKLNLISGFPPPMSYSIYEREGAIEPIKNDYRKAIELAKQQNKPVLIDFTGWACVNCRRMEEKVWVDDEVKALMKNDFIVVSLYVDERKKLPVAEQTEYTTTTGVQKSIVTVGDKWSTFQLENFYEVSQPQYAIISADEKALTKTKAYTPDAKEFAEWLKCGLEAYRKTTLPLSP